ncbi:MAG: hypothetical protein NVS3B26_25430 [Mycobacteriales bacterium]
MLAGMFLASAVAVLVATVVLLFRAPSSRPGRATPRWLTPLAALPVLGTGPLTVYLAGGTGHAVTAAAIALGVSDLLWLRLTRRWHWRGHALWAAGTVLSVSYLSFMLRASLEPGRSAVGVGLSLLLFLVELLTFVLGAAFLWEIVDVLARKVWLRRLPVGLETEPTAFPFVCLQVPAHNEPPEMVIQTLLSLTRLDYPAFEILMVDDNTTDTALWHPVRDWCAEHEITFVHLEDWPGYKSGALNYLLQHCTDARAEVIGVVDADYLVDPDYLRRCAPLFAERPNLGFVQTPQNYREWDHASYLRRLFYSYEYFFRVSQVSRNEQDAAIFGGTMGLIRRQALVDVGGWDEWCITEDAEASLKMLRAGWSGQHIEKPFGHGVMPLTFEALKRQRFRWCFGGIQILRAHWRSLLPWDRSPDNHLSQAQRWGYLSSALQWYGDLLGLMFAGFLTLGTVDLLFGGGLVLRRLSGVVLVLPALLVLLGLLRGVGVVKARTTATWRDAAGALLLLLALSWTVTLACVRGLVQKEGVFLRTPKTREEPSLRDAFRANRVESAAGLILAGFAITALVVSHRPATVVLVALVAWQATGLLSAPYNSLAAMRADLSPALRRRRRTEWLRENVAPRVRPVSLGLGAFGSVAAIVFAFALLQPAHDSSAPTRTILGELRGQPPLLASPSRRAPQRRPAAPTLLPSAATTAGRVGRTPGPVQTAATPAGTPTSATAPPPATPSATTPRATAATTPATRPSAATTKAATPAPAASANSTSAATARPSPAASSAPSTRPSPTPRAGRPSP